MRIFFILSMLIVSCSAFAQKYVDMRYQISTTSDISYGKAIDFAGDETNLGLDISIPTDDTAPACGRPLMIFIHGGAFMLGDKGDAGMVRFREDFAKRGYATASVGYRLGMFHTEKNVHCNVSNFGLDWDCLNMADTGEWYRAYYRAVQDVNGAVRYLVNNAQKHNIDPQNIFIVGESAGGFVAMGVGFITDTSEVLSFLIGAKSAVSTPNKIYESPCIQKYGLDTSLQTMKFDRPHLGSYKGNLNTSSSRYVIRGVGNFYGAVFNNIFTHHLGDTQAFYLYHQPNDLIVPFGYNKVFQGTSVCASQFPFNCQGIINRPYVYGSKGIKDLLDAGKAPVVYKYDVTSNTANCALQLANPSLSGHQIDNYATRTTNMANFFADFIEDCSTNAISQQHKESYTFLISPNPNSGNTITITGDVAQVTDVKIYDFSGRCVSRYETLPSVDRIEVMLHSNRASGLYTCVLIGDGFTTARKLILK